MKKYLTPIGVIGIAVLVLLFGLGKYSLLDTEYLFGWGRFEPFPEEIRQKHAATIEKVDALLKQAGGEMTTQHKNFNLELYLKLIKVGVLPYLQEDDPLRPQVQSLAEDIGKYVTQ